MKTKSNNNFTEKTRYLFSMNGWIQDWERGTNDADCLHHILGRVSNSPYNVAPLNNFKSHMPEGRKNMLPINCFEVRSKFLKKTKVYLNKIKYKPTEKDLEFLEENKKYYE